MRLRGDRQGEIGVFEDLQTLVVVLVGIVVLLGSTLFNWSSFTEAHAAQELYDEAEHIIDQIEALDTIRSQVGDGLSYDTFRLSHFQLRSISNSYFTDKVRSDFNYNVTFDDLAIDDDQHDVNESMYSYHGFGSPLPEDGNTVSVQIQYVLVIDDTDHLGRWYSKGRHPCRLTVVVWA